MSSITISDEKRKIAMEKLIDQIVTLTGQESVAMKRLEEIKKDPSIAISEAEIDAYLKKRGVKLDSSMGS
ncbi:MAG: hypothetical protein QF632_03145 [Candidatus Woesearchaeota archaeon]|jgi:hypothetical protein|nr:hypothetical protein [Candidatus Woesearchaeota archaeon]MDP7457838.1 hypothetical protein [Candidatus Woesearchaeota archaeon]|tara:strand:- start:178 stop:387 length:210 start_codon:yes stop_codon:yes gene_type:complete